MKIVLVLLLFAGSVCNADLGAAGLAIAAGANSRATEAEKRATDAESRLEKSQEEMRFILQGIVQVLGSHGIVYAPPREKQMTREEIRKARGY